MKQILRKVLLAVYRLQYIYFYLNSMIESKSIFVQTFYFRIDVKERQFQIYLMSLSSERNRRNIVRGRMDLVGNLNFICN